MVWIIKTELDECPFCGGSAELKLNQHALSEETYCVRSVCKECGASTPQELTGKMLSGVYVTLDEAIIKAKKRWNRRDVSKRGEAVTV